MSKNKLITKEIAAKLRAGVKRALEIPEGLDMDVWVCSSNVAPCGTGGCFAFELAAAHGRFRPRTLLRKHRDASSDFYLPSYAANLVGLDLDVMRRSIFNPDKWPHSLWERYYYAATPVARAEALRDAVEDFIAKDGQWGQR